MSVLSRPYFHDEEKAFEHLEDVIWRGCPVCPHCGGMDRISKVRANPEKRIRIGLWRCGDCKRQFTIKVGTVFEHARLPLAKALQAIYLLTSSKKGISAHQLHRTLGVTYKTAWFLAHRIREAMRSDTLAPLGGGGGIVEVDETFIGVEPYAKQFSKARAAFQHKMKVLALVDRDTGRSKAMVIDAVAVDVVRPILLENIAREARLCTDESGVYFRVGKAFAAHGTVNHKAREYSRGPIHTNTIEGYFSIFKRGMKGVYQHCGKKHLHRYLAEFDFRYSNREATGTNDADRCLEAMKGIVGKRLTYRRPDAIAS